MTRLDAIAAQVRRHLAVRMGADPRLSTWIGGSIGVATCVYAARSQPHAEAMHGRRRDFILRTRRAERKVNPVEAHRDAPFCPECTLPCGTTDREDITGSSGWVCCMCCGHSWESWSDRVQALAYDVAYDKHSAEEEIAFHDHARMGDELWDRNAQMLAAQDRRRAEYQPGVQADLFGGGS